MEKMTMSNILVYIIIISSIPVIICDKEHIFIVSVRPPKLTNNITLEQYYTSFLPSTPRDSNSSSPRLIYSYKEAFSGFAAMLTVFELMEMEKKEGFLHAQEDYDLYLKTTHSPEFLGIHFDHGIWHNATAQGEGIIIGILDDGVKSSHPSFNDSTMPVPPKKWKGSCKYKDLCNNKIIGMKSFPNFRDEAAGEMDGGHGTHMASIAAGTFVGGINEMGYINATMVGIAPRAHIAIYQVCHAYSCSASDVLAGIDAAIEDGVDIISLSIGYDWTDTRPFHRDVISIGSLAAVEKGIFVSCSTGNDGGKPSTVENSAPWILTVAAGTTDRAISSTVELGNGQTFDGQSLYVTNHFPTTRLPLVYIEQLFEDCVTNHIDVKGKIVVCQYAYRDSGTLEVRGAAGIISFDSTSASDEGIATPYCTIPSSHVGITSANRIIDYIESRGGNAATASLLAKGVTLGVSPSPVVYSFSGMGPSRLNPHILKPDITGPGVDILAAWSPTYGSPIGLINDDLYNATKFYVSSGTSVSAAHLTGVVALLKTTNPSWSPAALKSSVMTTSDILGRDGEPIKNRNLEVASFYEMGAGYVNPSLATSPGLVYELSVDDYVPFVCGLGYEDEQATVIFRRNVSCSALGKRSQWDLNYPTIAVPLQRSVNASITVSRRVTNVGSGVSVYNAEVEGLAGIEVVVEPKTLTFEEVKEAKDYKVTFIARELGQHLGVEGNLRWRSERHVVRSAIRVNLLPP